MEGFEQLSHQYQPMIHKIMRSLNIYKNMDEYYQLGLIALWEASNRFNSDKGNFSTYAYTCIKGKILNEMNKIIKREERMIQPEEEFWDVIVDPNTDNLADNCLLLSLCKDLTPNQKKWLMYTSVGGLTTNDIAILEKVSPSAVKSWRKGARDKLKKTIII